MKVDHVQIITKKNFLNEHHWCPRRQSKNPLVLEVAQRDENGKAFFWACMFTPWRLFATFFVKNSKFYKARMEPW